MNIIEEFDAMHQRQLDILNEQYREFRQRLVAKYGGESSAQPQIDYEVTMPLKSSTALFKGRRPTSVIFPDSSRLQASTWKNVVKVIFEEVVKDSEYKIALYGLCGKVLGKKREILAMSGNKMKSPIRIAENLYLETHYDTESLLTVMTKRILEPIGYDYSGIMITILGG